MQPKNIDAPADEPLASGSPRGRPLTESYRGLLLCIKNQSHRNAQILQSQTSCKRRFRRAWQLPSPTMTYMSSRSLLRRSARRHSSVSRSCRAGNALTAPRSLRRRSGYGSSGGNAIGSWDSHIWSATGVTLQQDKLLAMFAPNMRPHIAENLRGTISRVFDSI